MKKTLVSLTIFILFMISGCAHLSLALKDPKEKLRIRVETFWKLKEQKEWDRVYAFYCQRYRSEIPKKQFLSSSKINILDFQIDQIYLTEHEEKARVHVKFDTSAQGFDLRGVSIQENWVYEQNNWYLCPSARGFKNILGR